MISQNDGRSSMDDFSAKLALAERLLETDPLAAADHAQACLVSGDRSVTARAAFVAGSAMYRTGHLEEARPFLTQAREGFLALAQPDRALRAMIGLGRVNRDLGRFEDAAVHFTEAFDLAQARGDQHCQVDALNLQASVLSAQGDDQRALGLLERALGIAGSLTDAGKQANLRNNMGELLRLQGNYPDALEQLKAAHDLYQEARSEERRVGKECGARWSRDQ